MTATNGNLLVTVLDWLNGRIGEAKGQRVLVQFCGGYLGVIEPGMEEKGGDYIRRYYLKDGEECDSSRKGPPNKDEVNFSQECGKVMNDLILAGMIGWREPPKEHEGIAVYGLGPVHALAA